MIIEITEKDIQAGIPQHCWKCPIGLAVERYTGKRVEVHPSYVIVLESDETGLVYRLPKVARAFIRAFDDGVKVEPFSFTMEPVPFNHESYT